MLLNTYTLIKPDQVTRDSRRRPFTLLGIQCNFSGYCVAFPIKNKEHETVVAGIL